MKKLISIIVPSYNPNEKYMSELLHSISMQQFNDYELIIVDDGSTNDVIEKVVNQYPEVQKNTKIITNTRTKGISGAINTGICAANSHYITHPGDDDLYAPSTFLFVQPQL